MTLWASFGTVWGPVWTPFGTRWDTVWDCFGFQASPEIKVRTYFDFGPVGRSFGEPFEPHFRDAARLSVTLWGRFGTVWGPVWTPFGTRLDSPVTVWFVSSHSLIVFCV